MRKSFALLFVLVLATSGVATFLPARAEPKTITVPDDYPTIQAAIDNAGAGDTIYVKKGTYYHDGPLGQRIDGITIDKPISLIGEDSKTTILKPNYTSINRLRSGIHVTADDVTISGFTIDGTAENSTYKNILGTFKGYQETGILVHMADNGTQDPYGCKIIGNIFTGNFDHSVEDHGKSTFIFGNTITEGISLVYSSDTIVSGNNIEFNAIGIGVGSCANVIIKQNNIIGNGLDNLSGSGHWVGGISLGNSGDGSIYIHENNITDSDFGIKFQRSNNCFVYNNNIIRNKIGIFLPNQIITDQASTLGTGNRVYYNNLINNEENALVEHTYPNLGSLNETYGGISGNGTDVVSWDNGVVGNYWSDYLTKYPNASEIGNTGIGDMPYVIDEDNVDGYPLLRQVDVSSSPHEPVPTMLIVAVAVVAVVAACAGVLIYFKKLKR